MIPVLYESTETTFTTYGIGALPDVVSCVVTEERNGQFELIMQYPITGKRYSELQGERILKAKTAIGDQLFRIYRISKPLRGIVSVYAQHISYDLTGVALTPFSGDYTAENAMNLLFTGTGFTGHSDKTGTKTVGTTIPKSVRSMLGGTQGSLLDLWGGEYKWDNFDVYLYVNRGLDKQVVIQYGKNLTELLADHDLSEVYSELLPYATYIDDDGVSHTVTGDPITITSVISRQKTLIKDFSYNFDSTPTQAQVEAAATAWLADNPLGYETPSLTVSFTDPKKTADLPPITIDLCDTVTVRYTALGVDVKAKIVKSEYDTLREKYNSLTIGKPRASMVDTIANVSDQVKEITEYPEQWKSAIEIATNLITGNAGGTVVLHKDAYGKPYELLILDNPDISQAQKVWRWTLGGLGYSSTGYSGPYATAITADGKINADFVLTGTLVASLIKAGIISDVLGKNSWNLDTGALTITDGVITATFTETIDHSDYSQADLDILDNLSSPTSTPLTPQEKLKYDIDGAGLIDDDDYDRIQYMITTGNDIQRTVTTTIDPKSSDKAIRITTTTPATGTVPACVIESYYSGAKTQSATVYCDRVVFSGDTHATMIASEYDDEISIGKPSIRPWGHSEDDIVVPNDAWKTVNDVDLPPGMWYITANARFTQSSTGRRMICISTDRDDGASPGTPVDQGLMVSTPACSGARTGIVCAGPFYCSTQTHLYMNCFQNSGGSKGTLISLKILRVV